MDAKKFGGFVAARRRELAMTQADLAKLLHVTDKAVSRWERGVGFPDIETLEPLADALEVTLFELLRSERSGWRIPAPEAEQALWASLDLAVAQRERERDRGLTVLCGLAAVWAVWALGVSSLFGVVIFFSALLAAFLSWGWGREAGEERARRVYLAISMVSAGVAGVCGGLLLPELFWTRYGGLAQVVLLSAAALSLAGCLLRVLLDRGMRRAQWLACAAALLILLGFQVGQVSEGIRRIGADAAQERVNVVMQYAELSALHDLDIDASRIIDRSYTYSHPEGAAADDYLVVFTYRPQGSQTDRRYAYRISMGEDFLLRIVEQGEVRESRPAETVASRGEGGFLLQTP